jgi:lactate dehydrogenase-like 2-hydroxyacid dehydrogenase
MAETPHRTGARELRLVNASCGHVVVDEPALAEALEPIGVAIRRERVIAGAGIDVFEKSRGKRPPRVGTHRTCSTRKFEIAAQASAQLTQR